MNFRITPAVTSTLAISVLLSACATNSQLSGSSLSDKINQNFIVVNEITRPATLAERTKAQAIGKFVVATAVSSIAASGDVNTKPGDFKAFQKAANEQMEFGKEVNKMLTQNLPDSYKVTAGAGADLAIAKKMSEYYAGKSKPDAHLNPKTLQMSVNTDLWELGYISFLTSQNYALSYSFTANLKETVEGKETIISSATCSGTSEKEIPLEQWKAENYQTVNAEAEKIVAKCYEQFVRHLG